MKARKPGKRRESDRKCSYPLNKIMFFLNIQLNILLELKNEKNLLNTNRIWKFVSGNTEVAASVAVA